MSQVLIFCWLLFNASYAFADVETQQTGGTGKKGACFSRLGLNRYRISSSKLLPSVSNCFYSVDL